MGETYVESALWSSAVSWNFTDGFLVTAFNNAPVLSNVKNDYSIWGTRQSSAGELPVHLRYAIDKKPSYYKCIYGTNINPTYHGLSFTYKGDIHYNATLATNYVYTINYTIREGSAESVEYGNCFKVDFQSNDIDNQRKTVRFHDIEGSTFDLDVTSTSSRYKTYGHVWVFVDHNGSMQVVNPGTM